MTNPESKRENASLPDLRIDSVVTLRWQALAHNLLCRSTSQGHRTLLAHLLDNAQANWPSLSEEQQVNELIGLVALTVARTVNATARGPPP